MRIIPLAGVFGALAFSPFCAYGQASTTACISHFFKEPRALGIAAPEADELIQKVADSIGLQGNIIVIPCDFTDKTYSFVSDDSTPSIPKGEYVIYNPDWVREVIGNDRIQAVALFGHELGHILNRYFGVRRDLSSAEKEKEADHFAGCAVARLGGHWSELKDVLSRIRRDRDKLYPDRLTSLDTARSGYLACGGIIKGAPQEAKISEIAHNNVSSGSAIVTPKKGKLDEISGKASSLFNDPSIKRLSNALFQEYGLRVGQTKSEAEKSALFELTLDPGMGVVNSVEQGFKPRSYKQLTEPGLAFVYVFFDGNSPNARVTKISVQDDYWQYAPDTDGDATCSALYDDAERMLESAGFSGWSVSNATFAAQLAEMPESKLKESVKASTANFGTKDRFGFYVPAAYGEGDTAWNQFVHAATSKNTGIFTIEKSRAFLESSNAFHCVVNFIIDLR